jgi:outer membrane lipoprotein-sorting protein
MDLLFASVLLLQAKTPEETLRLIEESFDKARTITIKYSKSLLASMDGTEVKMKSSGEIYLKQDRKIRVSQVSAEGPNGSDYLMVSDGTTMWARLGSDEPKKAPTPSNLRGLLITRLCRRNLDAVEQATWVGFAIDYEKTARNDKLEISKLAFGPDDGSAITLVHEHEVKTGDADYNVKTKIWLDPQTYRLIKRTINTESASLKQFVTETYDQFALDSDIPDEKFKPPAGWK